MHATNRGTGLTPFPSPYAWIFSVRRRALSAETKLGTSAKLVLVTLLEHVDPEGRTWIGVESIAESAGFGSTQTVRKALQKLVDTGWLKIVPQTWASLTLEQATAGRTVPRRGDVGQAPHLYVILDGHGNPACGLSRPRLARVSPDNPPQILEEPPSNNQQGEPLSKLIADQDPAEDLSMNESAEPSSRVNEPTHISSLDSSRKTNGGFVEAWNVLVEAHIEKTKALYGLPPLAPDLKLDQRQALSSSLEGAAVELRAQIQARTGTERDLAEVRRDLAARTMHLYFKRDNEHLRRVKHALRDLPREWHARLTEAMQAIMRASIDATPPRRALRQEPGESAVSADKPVEVPQQTASTNQRESVDKPVQMAPRKPTDVVANSADVAREARRLLEALKTTPAQQDPAVPSKLEAPTPTPVREETCAEPARARDGGDKPRQDKRVSEMAPDDSFEQQLFDDKPSRLIDRPLGRSGAPRWGALGPRPATRLCARKREPVEDESEGCAERSS